MKKFTKKALAVLLALVMVSGAFVSLAANEVELNQAAADAHYGQYGKYLLLGDSAASGYRDVIESDDENDKYNRAYNQSVYTVVPGSYADIIGKAIGAETTSYAAPGYRTIELRYMLEDDYAETIVNEDDYLFHPSQLYVFDDQKCDCHDEYLLPGSEHFRSGMKNAIAEADVITLGIGGNDWGEYLTWVLTDVLEEENVADEYIQDAKEILDKSTMAADTVEQVVDIAHTAGALRQLLERVPAALEYGLSNFYKNWNCIIEDIYALNPDVTLMVLGMGDSGKKGYYYGYNGKSDQKIETAEQDETTAMATELITNLILGVANAPMKEGAEKYGYTFVDTNGTTFVTYHQDADGHVFIANKVLEALPDKEVSQKYTDIAGNKYYSAIEYVLINGIMEPASETTFNPDAAISKGDFHKALNKITGSEKSEDSTKGISVITAALNILGCAVDKDGAEGFFKTIALGLKVIADSNFNVGNLLSRAQAASYLMTLAEI